MAILAATAGLLLAGCQEATQAGDFGWALVFALMLAATISAYVTVCLWWVRQRH